MMAQNWVYLGKTLALSSALFWAMAVILFRISGKHVHPIGLNLFKSALSGILMAVSLLVFHQPFFPALPWHYHALLLLSGIIGIGISDTLLFAGLNRLGASLTAIVTCSYSPFVIILAAVFLGESISGWQMAGAVFIISAVSTISVKTDGVNPLSRANLLSGIFLGLAAMLFMAVSIVLMKPLLNQSSLLWASLIRITGGILFLGGVMCFHPSAKRIRESIFSRQSWKPMLSGSFLGGYLALIAWMGGMKYAQASEASVLNQMNTIFIFVLGILFLKERLTPKKTLAFILAAAGVILVVFF
ncbi:MAG: DMT family transporter [Candidatus Aminicenantes bacterium]